MLDTSEPYAWTPVDFQNGFLGDGIFHAGDRNRCVSSAFCILLLMMEYQLRSLDHRCLSGTLLQMGTCWSEADKS